MSSDPSKPERSSNTSAPKKGPFVSKTLIETLQTNPFREQMPTTLAKRDGKFGQAGKKVVIEVNSHAVKEWPDKTVYQYDVSLPLWSANALFDLSCRSILDLVKRDVRSSRKYGHQMPFSHNLAMGSSSMATRLAGKSVPLSSLINVVDLVRSPTDFGQGLRITVDLDQEQGQTPRPGRENKHNVRVVKAKNDRIYLSIVRDYLDGKCDMNNDVLEAISRSQVLYLSV